MPAISVVVPVYKVEAYLHRCVDSILRQSFRDFDLILVDDGSPDNCGEICEDYARQDSRVHVIHQENGGLSAARNSGIDWAFGNSDSQWLAFIDSDDWVAPDYLEQLYRAVTQTGCRMSACDLLRTEGEPLPEDRPYACQVLSADDYYCSGKVHGGVTAVAWNKLYQKSLFETLRYPQGKLHEDEFTTYKMVYALDAIAVVPAKLYAYYFNPEGIIQSKWNPRRMHLLEAVEEQIAFAQEAGLHVFRNKAVEQYIYAADDQLMKAEVDPDQQQYAQILRKKLRQGLKWGRESGAFPAEKQTLWAYEKAYPCKILWWVLSKVIK